MRNIFMAFSKAKFASSSHRWCFLRVFYLRKWFFIYYWFREILMGSFHTCLCVFHLFFTSKHPFTIRCSSSFYCTFRIAGAEVFLILLSLNTCEAAQTKPVKNVDHFLPRQAYFSISDHGFIRLISSYPTRCAIEDFCQFNWKQKCPFRSLWHISIKHAAQKKSIIL